MSSSCGKIRDSSSNVKTVIVIIVIFIHIIIINIFGKICYLIKQAIYNSLKSAVDLLQQCTHRRTLVQG